MHLGIFAKTFPRPTFEETLDAIADRGITHVQFNMSCAGLSTLPERPEEDLCVWIARSFRERGLTMAAISGTFNLCDPDESRLAENLRRLGVLASACRWLDTRIITLCTGTRDPEDMWKWHPENVRRASWEILTQSMRTAVQMADRHEVTLAFEPERNNVVNSVVRARMLLDGIGSPWLKIVLDPANLMGVDERSRLPEILDEATEWLGPDIVLAHAKNPPSERNREGMLEIREYMETNDPRTLSSRIQHRREAEQLPPEMTEESRSPAPPYLLQLDDFYHSYVNSLNKVHYQGPVVLHGLHEDEVFASQALIREWLR